MKITKILIALVCLTMVGTVYAGEAKGNPFAEIWLKIHELEVKITSIQHVPGPHGPQGMAGPQGPVGPAGPSGTSLRVVDGNGQDLGSLVSVEGGNTMFTTHKKLGQNADAIIVFDQTASLDNRVTMRIKTAPALYFLEPHCAGQAFVGGDYNDIYPQQLYNNPARGYFLLNPSSKDRRSIFSRIDGNSSNCIQMSGEALNNTYEAVSVDQPFSLPIAWPLVVKEQ